jgi:tetratricopeptide (TPR) repeat protein
VLYQLGIVLRIEGKIWDALEVHQRLIDQFPTDANAQHIYANDQTVLGVPDKSIVTLEQLISQYPERMNYRVSYGNALNKMGRYTESITVINEVLEDNPYVVDAILALAEANMGLMQTQNWIAAATQAYQLNPENPVVNLWMHDVYLHTGELEESFKYLQQSLTIQPNFFLAHIAMGNFYWQTQQEDLAHKWLESASVIASWSGHAQGMLAQFMAETGRGKLNWKLLENEALALPYGRLPYHLENSIKKMIH